MGCRMEGTEARVGSGGCSLLGESGEERLLALVPQGGKNWRDAQEQTTQASEKNKGAERGRRWGNGATPHPKGRGGAAGGRRKGRSEGLQEALHPAVRWPVPCIPLSLSSPGNCKRKEGYCWAPGLSAALLADMAADDLSQILLRSPAARVEETPLPSRPASLCAPLPAGRPATAEHRARAAREEAQRADNHRVHSLDGLSPRRSTHSPLASAPGRKRNWGKSKWEGLFACVVCGVCLPSPLPPSPNQVVRRCCTWCSPLGTRRLFDVLGDFGTGRP